MQLESITGIESGRPVNILKLFIRRSFGCHIPSDSYPKKSLVVTSFISFSYRKPEQVIFQIKVCDDARTCVVMSFEYGYVFFCVDIECFLTHICALCSMKRGFWKLATSMRPLDKPLVIIGASYVHLSQSDSDFK